MPNISKQVPLEFFAAANGADGFRSYFDDIFSSETFDEIFILKGGPGTGKSTLLKELSHTFTRPGITAEIFYCSSDPKSLDGVLLSGHNKKVAILDGTAPHERDARIPGATDILVNLGDAFNKDALRKNKTKIVSLQKEKNAAYKDAYFYLRIFGIFLSKIEAEAKSRVKTCAVNEWIQKEISPFLRSDIAADISPRLIRSFSKEGVLRLDTFEKNAEVKFMFFGDHAEGGILLKEIATHLSKMGCNFFYAPSPFADSLCDGIFLKNEKISITLAEKQTNDTFDTSNFFSPISKYSKQNIESCLMECDRYCSLAKNALQCASEKHFALERIYTPAMNFDLLNPLKDDLKMQISSLLEA